MICCDKASSTAANELSWQWAVRFSTAHRLEIRRALYLMPSNNKIGFFVVIRVHLRSFACLKNAHIRQVCSAFSACDKSPNMQPF